MTGDMARFKGKVAIVTGAGRGIGRETALLLARNGAAVVVNDVGAGPMGGGSESPVAQQVADEIIATGGNGIANMADLSTMAGGEDVVNAAVRRFGRIDILINNAGIIRPRRIDQMSEEDFDRVLAVNLKGYFATTRHAASHLIESQGCIVNMSSPSGWGHYSMSSYSAAKEGVAGFSRTVARDLGQFGVRCNVIRPMSSGSAMAATKEAKETKRYSIEVLDVPIVSHAWLRSGMEGTGFPCNVAAAAVWLCTSESAPLNGEEIFISGGHIARVQQPELIRSQFKPGGWDLDGLCDPETVAALTVGVSNRYPRLPHAER